MALTGNGFFVVSQNGQEYLTRDGNFATDNSGNLITTDGMSVMGYPAVNGVVNSNAPLVPINIPENETQAPSRHNELRPERDARLGRHNGNRLDSGVRLAGAVLPGHG